MAECKVDDVTYTSAPMKSNKWSTCRGCAGEHDMGLCERLGDCGIRLPNGDNFVWVEHLNEFQFNQEKDNER